MTERLDFAALYRELGLAPGCSSAHLRAAYRRRVSRLHPDQGGDAEDTGRLQQLNRLYRAALDFERAHGRLPGDGGGAAGDSRASTPAPDTWADPHPPTMSGLASAASTGSHAPPDAREGIPRSFLLVVLAAVCVLAWRVLVGIASPSDAPAEHVPAPYIPVAAATRPLIEQHDGRLLAGMSREMVLDIQGEPLDRRAQRWLYGPSWVEFACDRVVDWYSSPLQPLRVRMERPKATAAEVCAP